ncbi:hypothetical protein V1477_020704, partial [Vespula maculifrons]
NYHMLHGSTRISLHVLVLFALVIYAIIIRLDSRFQQLDRIRYVVISTQEWNAPCPDIRQSFSKS